MPLGDLAAGFFEILGRLLFQFFVEIILEIVIKGPGYLIAKYLLSKDREFLEQSEAGLTLIGVSFWLLTGLSVYALYKLF